MAFHNLADIFAGPEIDIRRGPRPPVSEHPKATKISKAKILEIPENRYGLSELRKENLRAGSSEWLSWSSAVGTMSERKASRNHILKYFANGSCINRFIYEVVKDL